MTSWFTGLPSLPFPSKKAELSFAGKSEYLWWLAFLRLSQDYWWLCHEEGHCLDLRMCTVWHTFGNVFEYDTFNEWWQNKAELVFAETTKPPKVTDITIQSQLLMIERDQHALLEIPLYMSDQDILDQVLTLIHLYPNIARQFQSSAKHILLKTKTNERKQIPIIYQIALLARVVDCINQIDPSSTQRLAKMKSYEIGSAIHISPSAVLQNHDSLDTRLDKQNRTRALVSQKKKKAEKIIANVEVGRYLSCAEVKPHVRWSVAQSKEMNAAIANGDWFNQSAVAREYTFLTSQLPLDMNDQNGYEKIIAEINAFKEVGK